MENIDFPTMQNLIKAIEELSEQLEASREPSQKESEILKRYQDACIMLEFTLVTGGIIKGVVEWFDNQSVGVKADNGQSLILYKHTIAFIQEKKS